jgi:hypothetical protein
MGLAKKLDKKKSIVKQIQKRIKHHKTLNKKALPKSRWQQQIDAIISDSA